jgi:hypothetical protein
METNTTSKMKSIEVITKGAAARMHLASLFKPVNGRTLVKRRYDFGKYRAEASFIGRTLDNCPDDVVAVWCEIRRDSDGPYRVLYCISAAPVAA